MRLTENFYEYCIVLYKDWILTGKEGCSVCGYRNIEGSAPSLLLGAMVYVSQKNVMNIILYCMWTRF